MARDKVKRNVVELCSIPKGQPGRPSKALTFVQAEAVLTAAADTSMHACIVPAGTQRPASLGAHSRSRFAAWTHSGSSGKTRAGTGWPLATRERRTVSSSLPPSARSWTVGHSGTAVTEEVYRKQIRPVIQTGAVAMDGIFKADPKR